MSGTAATFSGVVSTCVATISAASAPGSANAGAGPGTGASCTTATPDPPTAAGISICQVINNCHASGCTPTFDGYVTAVSVAGTSSCSSTSGSVDLLTALAGNTSSVSGLVCYGGCGYTNSAGSLRIGTGSATVYGQAVPNGVSCSPGSSGAASQVGTPASCATVAGQTVCASASTGAGTLSIVAGGVPDAIVPQTPTTPDTCTGFASGAMECNADSTVSSPPAPSTASSASTPATPTAVVAAGGHTENYYSPATVAASLGVSAGKGTSGTTAGTGTGSSGTGTGDCVLGPGEAGADDPSGCTGTTPTLTRTDTVQSNVTSMMSAIQASPLFSAFGSLSSAVGSGGSCPTASVTLATLGSHSFNFLQTACTIFADELSTMITIADAAWALLGLVIIISA